VHLPTDRDAWRIKDLPQFGPSPFSGRLMYQIGGISQGWRRQISELLAAAEQADGVAPVSEAHRLALRNRADDAEHWLAWQKHQLIAYCQVLDGQMEMVVAPAQRRCGIGQMIITCVLRQVAGDLLVWAHGDLPGSRLLARAVGAQPQRYLLRMGRGLTDWPVPQTPLAAPLRTFQPGQDEAAWLAVNAAAFVNHPEQGRITQTDLAARMAEPWFEPTGLILAPAPPEFAQLAVPMPLAGFVWTKVKGLVGEIYVIGVHPACQGHGLGRRLLMAGLDDLAKRGADQVILYVEGSAEAALALYRSLGFVVLDQSVQYRLSHR
jgi:mycothiol synthase